MIKGGSHLCAPNCSRCQPAARHGELKLVPEPDNPHDPDAVGVWDAAGEHQAGYLPRDRARLIGRRLRRGNVSKAISLWEWKQAGSGERVALEILIAPDVPIEFED